MTTVNTVSGPVAAAALGVTLPHEHLLVDATPGVWNPPEAWKQDLRQARVEPARAWLLRDDPFCCVDNCRLDDEDTAAAEASVFAELGGRTIVDPTCQGMGRDVAALARLADRTGLQIVAAAGWYLHTTHRPDVAEADVGALEATLAREVAEGLDDTAILPGIIGEIGVSPRFTPAEERCLRAAARVQANAGLPLMVHLPGWQRYGHRVLDTCEAEGADPHAIILAHMNPSGGDPAYQRGLAARGAWLEFDMVGMGLYYADQDAQSPSADDDARAIAGLIEQGYGDRLLASQDVFLKIMWTRHGGNGFGFVQRGLLPRLRRLGVPAEFADDLMVANPRAVFEIAGGDTDHRRTA